MTPKQKAKELVGKMCLNDCTDKNIDKVKDYALIAVDEILDSILDSRDIEYWQDVKREIELL